MVLAHEHVHARVEQGSVGHVGVVERLLQHAPVEVVGVQDAHFAAERAHVVDDLAGAALAQDEFVIVSLALLHHVHERLHAERVVLRGHGQPQVGGAFIGVAHLQHVGLLDHLARVAQKLGAVVGQRHTAVAAREHGDAQLLLQLLDGGGQVRLRGVEVLGGGVDGAVLGNGDEVAKLLKGHGGLSFLVTPASWGKMPSRSAVLARTNRPLREIDKRSPVRPLGRERRCVNSPLDC